MESIGTKSEASRFARFRVSRERGTRAMLAGTLAALALAGVVGFTTSPASADQPDFICEGYSPGTPKINTTNDPATVPYTAPAGYVVDEYCVKAATQLVIVPVVPPSRTITIDHPTVGSVSHYSVSWVPACPTDRDIAASSPGCIVTPPQDVEVTPSVVYTPPTCDADGTVQRSEGNGYGWRNNEDGTWTAEAAKGFVIRGTQTFGPYKTARLSGENDCPTTTTITPTDPPVEVASESPVPPAAVTPAAAVPAAAPPAPAAVPTQLPSTGSSSWVMALIALVSLAGGTGLLRLSRRPTD